MKYCTRCGTQLVDEAIVCIGCGCAVAAVAPQKIEVATAEAQKTESGATVAAKVFMVLGTIVMGLFGYLIPLAWCIPMTVSYFKKVKNNLPISNGFKVCSLLFVSMIGGILMLCDRDH